MPVVSLRRWCLVLTLVAGTAPPADAFKFWFHEEITYEAIGVVLEKLPADVRRRVLSGPGATINRFSDRAQQEIVRANKARDTDDCGRPDDYYVAASPCGQFDGVGAESWAALQFLEKEPAEDHFDNERIEASNDLLIARRGKVIDSLRSGNYIGARKYLGGALHALQDFYSHSNYVELGLGRGGTRLEPRLGRSTFLSGTFAEGLPRVADPTQQTCWAGSYLFNKALRDKLFSMTRSPAAGTKETDALVAADQFLLDPRLTTGVFFTDEPAPADKDKVEKYGKCLHGWEIPGISVQAQPGIHKDNGLNARGSLYREARQLAVLHSTAFISDLITELMTNMPCQACVLGLMGYDPTEIISAISVGIPGAPNGGSWDTVLGGILRFNIIKNILPDILVCTESTNVPLTCAPICEDANWSIDLNAYVCSQPFGPSGFGALVEKDLRVRVRETDQGLPTAEIATFRVEDPKACDPFCSLELEPGRTVWIRFEIMPVTRYGGRRRPRPAILAPKETVPEAKPAGAAAPRAPAPPPPVPNTNSSSSSSSSTSSAERTAAAALPLRTAEGIDSRLGLRDMDNCTGADAFYPASAPASLTGAQAAQLYQMAAFSMAIADATAKQAVLNAVRTKVGDDAFYAAMTGVIADPLQSQTLVNAYQDTARNVVQQITSNGMTSLLPVPKPASALLADVDRWILARLASPALVSTAVDLMSGARPLTAECTLNELAKQGFTAAVVP